MSVKKSAAAKSSRRAVQKSEPPKANAGSRARQGEPGGDGAADEAVVTIDRRRKGRRAGEDGAGPPAATLERRKKVQRRRQIDPTTCERDYSLEEVEFMNAMDEYKRTSGRMFPTCSEVLEVIRSLGYVKLSAAGQAILEADAGFSENSDMDGELAGEPAFGAN